MKVSAQRVVIGGLVVALLGATGTAVYYASQARTPAQAAAETAEPDDTVVTVPVVTGKITAGVTVDGSVAPADVVDVMAPSEVAGADLVIVSDVPLAPGDEVTPGTVVLEVSGRPVIALAGDVPAYRGLVEGDRGRDVAQLQRALSTLYGTPESGVFDDRTAEDVRRLYTNVGYDPVVTADPDTDTVGRVTVPVGEIAFVPSLPARVGVVSATRGQVIEGKALTIAGGAYWVEAVLSPRERDLFTSPPDGARTVFGAGPWEGASTTLDRVEQRTLSGSGEPVDVGVFTVKKKGADPTTDARQQVILVTSESDEDALVVPLSAVWTDGSGSSMVTVADANGSTLRQVAVEVVVAADGLGAIEVVDGTLESGELVVVAWRDRTGS